MTVMTAAQPAPLSIGIVVPSFDRGGLEQVALNLYRGYRARGFRCVVLVENNTAGYMLSRLDDPADGIVINRDEGLFIETLAAHRIDVLHYHYASFGLRTATALGIYTLYTIHNVYTWLDDAAFAHRAAEVMAADRAVAVSRFVRDYFVRRAGIGPDRVDVILNGVDVDALSGRPAGAPPRLNVPDGRFVFALPASTFPVKHQPLAIRAAERLREKRRDFQLVLLGNLGEPDFAREVDALVQSSPAAAHITQCSSVPHEWMGWFYREIADCVILPTLQEGCSNVVLEALAFDRPMILTDVGNAREAAALSDRVRIVPRAEEDLDALTPARIAELSLCQETRNLRALTDAMAASLDKRGGEAADANALAARRSEIGLDRMVDAYLELIRYGAAFAPHGTGLSPATSSKTLETLA